MVFVAADEATTAQFTSASGETILIRPIEPLFWDDPKSIDIEQYFRQHDQHLLSRKVARKIVHHYTTLNALQGIVEKGKIWASDVRHLNDRAELSYALSQMYQVARRLWGEDRNPQPLDSVFNPGRAWQFVSCFSFARDQLSQWRGYGGEVGVSIAFDLDHLTAAADIQHGRVVECQYHTPDRFDGMEVELQPS